MACSRLSGNSEEQLNPAYVSPIVAFSSMGVRTGSRKVSRMPLNLLSSALECIRRARGGVLEADEFSIGYVPFRVNNGRFL